MRINKGKILSWVIFAILILMVFGLLLFMQSIRETEKAPSETRIEKETKITQPRKEFAVTEVAQDEKESRDNDAFNNALLRGEGCENIQYDAELRQLCFDTLAYNEALRKNDENICGQISDEKLRAQCYDQVYLSLALKNFDESLCEKIKDLSVKRNCQDQILVVSGVPVKNSADCDAISDAYLKQMCLDTYYFEASVGDLDEAGCERIKDVKLKERCMNTVVKSAQIIESSKKQAVRTYQTAEEKLKSCNEMTGDNMDACKNEANFSMAGEKKDISYCNNITDSEIRANCVTTQSVTINGYYLKQAIRLQNVSLCDKILDSSLRSTCIASIQ